MRIPLWDSPHVNFFKHHIGDYLKKTGTLSTVQHGVYFLMLMEYYGTEKPLPDGRDLYKICRANTKKERESVDEIVTRFWQRTETGLVNKRADEEIEKAQRIRELAKENGTQGGRPPKAVSKPSGFQNQNPAGFKNKPSGLHSRLQTPDSTNHYPDKTPPSAPLQGGKRGVGSFKKIGAETLSRHELARIPERHAKTTDELEREEAARAID